MALRATVVELEGVSQFEAPSIDVRLVSMGMGLMVGWGWWFGEYLATYLARSFHYFADVGKMVAVDSYMG